MAACRHGLGLCGACPPGGATAGSATWVGRASGVSIAAVPEGPASPPRESWGNTSKPVGVQPCSSLITSVVTCAGRGAWPGCCRLESLYIKVDFLAWYFEAEDRYWKLGMIRFIYARTTLYMYRNNVWLIERRLMYETEVCM